MQLCPSSLLSLFSLVACISGTQAVLSWRRLPNNGNTAPPGRRDLALGYDPVMNHLYMFGGRGSSSTGADFWRYDVTANQWTELSPAGPRPSARFSLVSGYSSRLRLFVVATGELLPRSKTFASDIWAYNLSTAAWVRLPDRGNVPEPRYGASGGLHVNGTSMYVTHGFSSRRFSNTLRYDLTQMRWVTEFSGTNPYSATEPKARCLQGGTMVSEDETMFYGGCLR